VFALSKTKAQVSGGLIDVYLTGSGQFELYDDGTLYRDQSGATMLLKKRMYADENGVSELVSEEGNGCLIINPRMAFYANDKACNSNLVNLLFSNGIEGYELLHANNFVRIYKIE